MVQRWKKPFGKVKTLEFEAEHEIELKAGVSGTTPKLASLLTNAFEGMWSNTSTVLQMVWSYNFTCFAR